MSEDPKRRAFYKHLYDQLAPPQDAPLIQIWHDGQEWRIATREVPEEIAKRVRSLVSSFS